MLWPGCVPGGWGSDIVGTSCAEEDHPLRVDHAPRGAALAAYAHLGYGRALLGDDVDLVRKPARHRDGPQRRDLPEYRLPLRREVYLREICAFPYAHVLRDDVGLHHLAGRYLDLLRDVRQLALPVVDIGQLLVPYRDACDGGDAGDGRGQGREPPVPVVFYGVGLHLS